MKALSLFSGGLDSILATRVVMAQGIEVVAVQFVSPFFNDDVLTDIDGYVRRVRQRYGITVLVEDISLPYLQMLRQPRYGFGKNFNPCIDCKIFMVNRAREMLVELGASFLISGEVLGQRPMSQRRDTLNVISRDTDCRAILLRPLSARLLTPTLPEEKGWVDRDRLLAFSGRGRSRQIALAREFGITDFPAPAGGCILADPILSRRIRNFYDDTFVVKSGEMTVTDIRLLLVGRQFLLPGGGWLILGRDEKDNDKLVSLAEPGDALLTMESRPGPVALLRRADRSGHQLGPRHDDVRLAAGLVARYGKKVQGQPAAATITMTLGEARHRLDSEPLADERFRGWML
ncbi:MAG: thiamine biosynthesis protein [Desulfopila sp.]